MKQQKSASWQKSLISAIWKFWKNQTNLGVGGDGRVNFVHPQPLHHKKMEEKDKSNNLFLTHWNGMDQSRGSCLTCHLQ